MTATFLKMWFKQASFSFTQRDSAGHPMCGPCAHSPGLRLHYQQDGGRDNEDGAKGKSQCLLRKGPEVPLIPDHGPEVTKAIPQLHERLGQVAEEERENRSLC